MVDVSRILLRRLFFHANANINTKTSQQMGYTSQHPLGNSDTLRKIPKEIALPFATHTHGNTAILRNTPRDIALHFATLAALHFATHPGK